MSETRTEWTIELPWTAPPLTLNQRNHWARRNRTAHEIADAVGWAVLAARLPKRLRRVELVLHWQPAIRRRRDDDNPMPTLKVIADALVRYGLVADDDSEHVTRRCVIEPVRKPARLWLSILDLSATENMPASIPGVDHA